MLISFYWLKKFTPIKVSPKELAEKITLNLVEVESLTKRGKDTILEIENKGITNRPDCFSHLGIAREVSAYFQLPLKDPLKKLSKKKLSPKVTLPLEVEVQEPNLCPRYCAVVLKNIKVAPSPKWLKTAVENCGVRSINNVVDITNYVMLELGQPLHAFDWEKIEGKKIIVRRAKKGEKIITLDGVKRTLTNEVLVIADCQRPIGIAGIMGGENTEVRKETKTIVLESANFHSVNNRLSSKFLKLRTEASTRFEKTLDINLSYPALVRAVELLEELAGAQLASQVFDLQFKKKEPWQIKVSFNWINRFLGINLDKKEIKNLLERLQLRTEIKDDLLIVTVPTFRPDLKMEADIAEEVARLYGYNKIPLTLPKEITLSKRNRAFFWKRKIKTLLTDLGFSEVYTYPLVGKKIIENAGLSPKNHLRLLNPQTSEREYFRISLLPSLLEAVKKNLQWFEEVKIFELARVYRKRSEDRVEENQRLVTLINGQDKFFQLKGIVETLMEKLGIRNYQFLPLDPRTYTLEPNLYHPTRSAFIRSKSELIGILGEVHPQILAKFGIEERVTVFDLDFDRLVQLATVKKTYQPIPRFPPIVEDLCFEFKKRTLIGEVIDTIKRTSKIIKRIELVDIYKQRRTFRIFYQSSTKNLTSKQIEKIRKKIVKNLEEKHNAILRSH